MKYTVFRGQVIDIEQGSDGLWRDASGTIIPIQDAVSADPKSECGVAPFAINTDAVVNHACDAHDFLYNSRAAQAFTTREEADEYLKFLIEQDKGSLWRFVAWPFFFLARIFGGRFWENDKTND